MSSTSDGNECRQPGTIDSTGLSADKLFFLCVMRGSDKKVAAIIEQSIVKPNIQGPDGKTALHISAAAGHHLVVQVLLEAECDESIADSDGWTAIRYALENGHRSVLNVLVQQQPASINQRVDPMQHTIIHPAATAGNKDSIAICLRSKLANPNLGNRLDQTPLHLAAWRRDLLILKHLLDAGADINAEDFWGETSLEVALRSLTDGGYYNRAGCSVEVMVVQTLAKSHGLHSWYEHVYDDENASGKLRQGPLDMEIVMADKLLSFESDRPKVSFLDRQSRLLG